MARIVRSPERSPEEIHRASPDWIRQDFQNATGLIRWLESNQNHVEKRSRASESASYKFCKTGSFDEAVHLFTVGWPEGVIEMQGYNEKIEKILLERVPREEIVHSLTGSDIDMSAYLAGAPENMLEWQIRPQQHQGVRILVNCGHRANVPTQVISARGAAIVAMIHALRLLNVPTELDLVWAAKALEGIGGGHEVRVRASSPGREVDIERLAFMVANPSMYRRLIFGVRERMGVGFRQRMRVPGGYGRAMNVMQDEKASIILPGPDKKERQWDTPEQAVAWTLERFEEIGIELEAA